MLNVLYENSLKFRFPALADEWNYKENGDLTPDNVLPFSSRKVHWQCNKGHKWEATIDSRTRNGYQCPYCAGKKAIPGETDIATLYPALAAEWDFERNKGLFPSQFLPKSNIKVGWICSKGHTWEARIADRVAGTGCPYCKGKLPIPGVNDLETKFPALAEEWDHDKNNGLRPSAVFPVSDRKVWWKCKHGHSWEAIIGNRTKNKSGCPYCTRKTPIVGVNDLASTHPFLMPEWDEEKNMPLTPQMVMANTSKKVRWICEKGHSFEASIVSRTHMQSGCPYCSGFAAITGETDLASQHPHLLEEWDYEKNRDLKPEEVSQFSSRKVWWRCKNGHSWKADVVGRTLNHYGCPRCKGKKN